MADQESEKPSYRSTLLSALLVAVTFLVVGFAMDWITSDFAAAMAEFWPSRVIAVVVLLVVVLVAL